MTHSEALKLALDALGKLSSGRDMDAVELNDLIATLEAALEQPEQEPVAFMYVGIKNDGTTHGPHLIWEPEYMDAMSAEKGVRAVPLYTHPPRREPEPVVWVWSHQLEELNELGSHRSIRAWANTASHRSEGLIPLYTRCERQA